MIEGYLEDLDPVRGVNLKNMPACVYTCSVRESSSAFTNSDLEGQDISGNLPKHNFLRMSGCF